MSGELLRRCAIFGDVDKIKNLLEQGSNPCSTDVTGQPPPQRRTSSTYLRILVAHHVFRNVKGRCSRELQPGCVVLKEIPTPPVRISVNDDIIFYAGVKCIDALLRVGADRSIRDVDGKTAVEVAIDAGRNDCARALNLEIGNAKNLADYRKMMEANLKVQRAQRMLDTPGEPRKRRAPKPHSLMMHEDEIKPFSEQNFTGKHAAETIRNLVIATEQAGINESRRKGLKNAQDVAVAKAMEQKFI
ncbi:unnamed protein product [Ectocarpus sp. 4 AP-2014]